MTSSELRSVAAVILTYNSSQDLKECLVSLAAQDEVDLRIIVVDNASRADELRKMEEIFSTVFPNGIAIDADDTGLDVLQSASSIFVRNHKNEGYSAGNNIGAYLGEALGCSAVLIINPDVRIIEPSYVSALSAVIHQHPLRAVAASLVRNLNGAQENPMSEPTFWREFSWPLTMATHRLFRKKQSAINSPTDLIEVNKVSGACFLIRTDFLSMTGFFDTSTFLYCEESILSAKVHSAGWHMVMDPSLEVLHAHKINTKGDPRFRYRTWAASRSYFHRVYGGHGRVAQNLLAISRQLILLLIYGRELLKHMQFRREKL